MTKERKTCEPWSKIPQEAFPRGYEERFFEFDLDLGPNLPKGPKWLKVVAKLLSVMQLHVKYWGRSRVRVHEITQVAPIDVENESELKGKLEGKCSGKAE